MKAIREVTSHRGASGVDTALTIKVLDEPGPGGASHLYRVTARGGENYHEVLATIRFQKGGVYESGINGLTNEALLAIVLDRLTSFQAGRFACSENAIALTKVSEAIEWLHARTRDRTNRGVEGLATE